MSAKTPDRTPTLVENPDVAIVLTTWPADRDPADFARRLLDEGLAACVNIVGEMRSFYRWQGHLNDEAERQLVIKTKPDTIQRLFARVMSLHPYEVPEFLVLPVSAASRHYNDWVGEAIAPAASPPPRNEGIDS
jgi:periplasmic divalent cation tolerance protein